MDNHAIVQDLLDVLNGDISLPDLCKVLDRAKEMLERYRDSLAQPADAEHASARAVKKPATVGSVMLDAARGTEKHSKVPAEQVREIRRGMAERDKHKWPRGNLFSVFDAPGEHDPCYLVMPDGCSLALNHHAENGVDQARAAFIADACNAALAAQAADAEHASAQAELADVSAAIGTNEWMDPPDGGDVTLAEQVRRMADEIKRLRAAQPVVAQADDGTTHAEGCWSWGRKHYECAVRELSQPTHHRERDMSELQLQGEVIALVHDDENFTLTVKRCRCATPPAQPASEALSENQRWNLAGREPYKFHLSASHVTPEYRDGWNHAITAVLNYGHAECRRLLAPPSDSKGG